jgi:hypothetical protein
MMENEEVKVQVHSFLTLTLDGGEWSVSCPNHFTPGESAPSAHLVGGWVGHTASLNASEKRKISYSCCESSSVVEPIAY